MSDATEKRARRQILKHLNAAYFLCRKAKLNPFFEWLIDAVIRRVEEIEMEAKK